MSAFALISSNNSHGHKIDDFHNDRPVLIGLKGKTLSLKPKKILHVNPSIPHATVVEKLSPLSLCYHKPWTSLTP